ncbi:MAG: FtsX-like permease family protein [Corynebacterium sp.]|nr:FtsX-like permease family protein [Corynebacterium sp.]
MRTPVSSQGGYDAAPGQPMPAAPTATPEISTNDDHRVMRSISWRSLKANKLRLGLTILAVILGTSFVAGSLMFTRSLSQTYDNLLNATIGEADAVVTAGEEYITQDSLQSLRERDDVASVALEDSTSVVVADGNRERLPGSSASGNLQAWVDAKDSDNPVPTAATLLDGAAPQGDDQVAVDADTFDSADLALGDPLILVDDQGQREVTIAGVYEVDDASQSLGLRMDEQAYIDNYTDGEFLTVLVQGVDSTSTSLVADLSDDYPGFEVKSGKDYAEDISTAIADAMRFVSYFLIAFGLLALLVGVFIIANTFSMIVAQRMKEFALLRALGVSKKQLSRSVLREAAIIGLIGSLLGVVVGVGLVQLIFRIMNARGMNLPSGGFGLSLGSVVVPVILGVIVTMISAYTPAQRAAKVHPVEAMRSGEANTKSSLKGRTIVGSSLSALAILLCLLGALLTSASTEQRTSFVGLGTLLLFLGIFLAAPALSIPLVGGIGKIVGKPFGAVGNLAATNSHRNPRRTATTAFALTIGIALVTSIGMLSASMKNSVEAAIEDEVKADFVIAPPMNSSLSIPLNLLSDVAEVDGVGASVSFGRPGVLIGTDAAQAQQNNFRYPISTMDGNPTDVFNIEDVEGDFSLSEPGQLLVSQDVLNDFSLHIGDTLTMFGYDGSELREVEIVGSFGSTQLLTPMVISRATFTTGIGEGQTTEEPAEETPEEAPEEAEEQDPEATEGEEVAESDDDSAEENTSNDASTQTGSSSQDDPDANVDETVVVFEDDPQTEEQQPQSLDYDVSHMDIEPASYNIRLTQDSEPLEEDDEPTEVVLVNASISTYAVYVTNDGSISDTQLRSSLEDAVRDYIVVDVYSSDEYAGIATALIDRMMNILYGLLALSVLIAALGIINTLALNVIERRQEIGMLRAIGTQQGQIRRMIFLESTQIALYGAFVGVAAGLLIGWSFLRSLDESGMQDVVVSWSSIGVLFVGAALIGVLAAVLPSQRAAKTPPLEAISS